MYSMKRSVCPRSRKNGRAFCPLASCSAISLLQYFVLVSAARIAYLGNAYARAGRREEAEKLAAAVSSNPFQQALIFAGLGDKDRTLEALDQAFQVAGEAFDQGHACACVAEPSR